MSDRHTGSMVPEAEQRAPHMLSAARSEEGWSKGDGGMVIRALLLILGGIAIVSYVMMTLANMDG
jgi:hypothetical protein